MATIYSNIPPDQQLKKLSGQKSIAPHGTTTDTEIGQFQGTEGRRQDTKHRMEDTLPRLQDDLVIRRLEGCPKGDTNHQV